MVDFIKHMQVAISGLYEIQVEGQKPIRAEMKSGIAYAIPNNWVSFKLIKADPQGIVDPKEQE